jgi:hypothetical protein
MKEVWVYHKPASDRQSFPSSLFGKRGPEGRYEVMHMILPIKLYSFAMIHEINVKFCVYFVNPNAVQISRHPGESRDPAYHPAKKRLGEGGMKLGTMPCNG